MILTSRFNTIGGASALGIEAVPKAVCVGICYGKF